MNDATLYAFRELAAALAGPEPRDWQWNGKHLSQQYYGITRTRARQMVVSYGGTCQQMPKDSITLPPTLEAK